MNNDEHGIEIGVAICTFNPDRESFERTLAAVEAQEIPRGAQIECVIVDNNSNPPIAELPFVKAFLERCAWARVIVESKQGLSYARIAAIEKSKAGNLCFVDDDNEPLPGYLMAAAVILRAYPCIGVIGPGRVMVNYLGQVSDEFARQFSPLFQQRESSGLTYGCVAGTWAEYYPPGSCMVVRREVLAQYREEYLAGRLSAKDRVGRKLSSGGDTQIVWEAVKMGFAAGISPELKLNHMIPAKRSTLDYVKRLCYGTSASYLPALVSSFPSQRAGLLATVPSNAAILWRTAKIVARHAAKLKFELLPIALATYFGAVVGTLDATGSNDRRWVYKFVHMLRLS